MEQDHPPVPSEAVSRNPDTALLTRDGSVGFVSGAAIGAAADQPPMAVPRCRINSRTLLSPWN